MDVQEVVLYALQHSCCLNRAGIEQNLYQRFHAY